MNMQLSLFNESSATKDKPQKLEEELKQEALSKPEAIKEEVSDKKEENTEAKAPSQNRGQANLEESWLDVMGDEFEKPYMKDLKAFLVEEKKQYTVYPPGDQIFNAFWKTPFDKVKVVILGQDPYHGPKQAHGLCFSVNKGIKAPPSLVNIFKELNQSLSVPIPNHGCLEYWAQQGVFLLNTSLSVRAGQAGSHSKEGWAHFTDRVIHELNEQGDNIVFLLWGRHAQEKASIINRDKHLVLEAAHPSPFSAHNGFFGCNHFAKVNAHLKSIGKEPIDWDLTNS